MEFIGVHGANGTSRTCRNSRTDRIDRIDRTRWPCRGNGCNRFAGHTRARWSNGTGGIELARRME